MYVQLNMFVYIQNNGIILVVFACGIKCRFIFFAAWDGLCFFGETVPSITHGFFCSPYFCFSDVMWHTAKYGDPFSEFVLCIYPPKVHTHSSEHTHTPGAVGSQCCGALLKVISVVVLKVERVLDFHSPHLQFLPARDSNSQPFDYESNSLPLGHDSP